MRRDYGAIFSRRFSRTYVSANKAVQHAREPGREKMVSARPLLAFVAARAHGKCACSGYHDKSYCYNRDAA